MSRSKHSLGSALLQGKRISRSPSICIGGTSITTALAGENIAQLWLEGSLGERDLDSAARALAALPIAGCYDDWIPFPRAWCEGVVARTRGDKAAAQVAFTTARNEASKLIAAEPDYP